MNIINLLRPIGMFAKNHAPEILLGASTAATIGGIAFMIKDADKAIAVIDREKERRASSKRKMLDAREGKATYSRMACIKDHFTSHVRSVLGVIKAEWKGILCFTLAGVCKYGCYALLSHEISRLSSAYNAVSAAFATYRLRVAELIGDEKEKALYEGKEVTANVDGVERKAGASNYCIDFSTRYCAENVSCNFDEHDPMSNYVHFNQTCQRALENLFSRTDHIVTLGEHLRELGYNTRNSQFTDADNWGLYLTPDEWARLREAYEELPHKNIIDVYKKAGVVKKFWTVDDNDLQNFLKTNELDLFPDNISYLPAVYNQYSKKDYAVAV
jgi:hypothetical protein